MRPEIFYTLSNHAFISVKIYEVELLTLFTAQLNSKLSRNYKRKIPEHAIYVFPACLYDFISSA